MSLRELMVRTGAVISGSLPLAALSPQRFDCNDIDFYVLPFGFAAVLQFVERHGYLIVPYDHASQDYINKRLVVVRLLHSVSGKSINIITGCEDHVVKIITRFHSTLVMNYVSWFGLVVLYPVWTLNKVGLVTTDTPSTRKCFAKYAERGYALSREVRLLTRPMEDHVCGEDPYCPTTKRSLHDGHCFVEPFDVDEFEFEREEDDVAWALSVKCSFDMAEEEVVEVDGN
jgi:hypothetical protein